MFKKHKSYKEIDEQDLKNLKLFESIDAQYNSLGFAITYTRIQNGLIRTTVNTTGIDQLFIPLPAKYFINGV